MNEFELIAKTFMGLEPVLAKELTQLGANNVEIGRRMVSFTGDKEMMYRANFQLHTAIRILKPIAKFKAASADDVYEEIKKIDWSQYIEKGKTFSVDSVVYSEEFRNSRFVTYKVKDAIVDQFREKTGTRPNISVSNPDIRLNIHIAETTATLSLDSSGESLHRRGYRQESVEAPLNEVLAAGMILMTGWHGETDFIDPMCGSGTLAIEAALIAHNMSPGVFRKEFAFEKWPDFDAELFDTIYNDDSQEREFTHHIYGYDIDMKAINTAHLNVRAAGLTNDITIDCADFKDPMCGSGTLAIEAALIAHNMSPGVFRKEFAFEKWPDFDAELFDTIYNDDSQEREFTHHIYGYDIDMKAINTAHLNVRAAGLTNDITIDCADFKDFTKPAEKSILVVNPPYGERISTPNLLNTYKMIGERLKHAFIGNEAWVLSYRQECFEAIGLKPSIKIPVYNGSLECEFRKYSIFDGTMKDFRQEGGIVKTEEEKRQMAEKHRFKKNREFKKRLDEDEENAEADIRSFKFRSMERRKDNDDRRGGGKRFDRDDDKSFGKRDDKSFGKRGGKSFGRGRDDDRSFGRGRDGEKSFGKGFKSDRKGGKGFNKKRFDNED